MTNPYLLLVLQKKEVPEITRDFSIIRTLNIEFANLNSLKVIYAFFNIESKLNAIVVVLLRYVVTPI